MYELDLALNNRQGLTYHKTQLNQIQSKNTFLFFQSHPKQRLMISIGKGLKESRKWLQHMIDFNDMSSCQGLFYA